MRKSLVEALETTSDMVLEVDGVFIGRGYTLGSPDELDEDEDPDEQVLLEYDFVDENHREHGGAFTRSELSTAVWNSDQVCWEFFIDEVPYCIRVYFLTPCRGDA